MTDIRAKVQQTAPGGGNDGAFAATRQTRTGHLPVDSRESLVDAWTRDGRVFQSGTPLPSVPETMSASGTAIVLTAPSFRYTVPSGATVVPISASVSGQFLITKDALFVVMVTDTDTFGSGGTAAQSARNMLVQTAGAQARDTSVTNLLHSNAAIIEGSLTNERTLKVLQRVGAAADTDPAFNPEYNILKGDPMTYLIGPASFLVWIIQETTALEGIFTMTWAEIQRSEITP